MDQAQATLTPTLLLEILRKSPDILCMLYHLTPYRPHDMIVFLCCAGAADYVMLRLHEAAQTRAILNLFASGQAFSVGCALRQSDCYCSPGANAWRFEWIGHHTVAAIAATFTDVLNQLDSCHYLCWHVCTDNHLITPAMAAKGAINLQVGGKQCDGVCVCCRWCAVTGQNFTANHAPKTIDFTAVHLWPDNWQVGFLACCMVLSVSSSFVSQES